MDKFATSYTLQIKNLTKHFGPQKVLDQLSFEIDRGEVFFLLGPNGSGKTTLINCILSLIRHESGEIFLNGEPKLSTSQNSIGVILESDGFFRDMSAEMNLRIVCRLKDVTYDVIPSLLKKVSLEESASKPVRKLSQGMQKRLALAASLIGQHNFHIWDEPYNGLDPEGFILLRDIIRSLNLQGHTFLITTHLLDEVMKVGTKISILQHGQIRDVSTVKDIISKHESIERYFFTNFSLSLPKTDLT